MTAAREAVGPAVAPRIPRATAIGRGAAGLAWAASAAVAVSSGTALVNPRWAYGDSAPDLVDQGTAQDVVGLLLVAPLLAALTWSARRASSRATDLWRGACLFVAYNAAIYAFAVSFGPLFPVWVAALGLSVYAVVLGPGPAARPSGPGPSAPAWAGVLVVTVGVIFGAAWLGQLAADLARGGPSESAEALGLPTNPVHVLDLALLVPGAVAVGLRSLRRTAAAWELPSTLLVLLLMCLPILLTPAVQAANHESVDADVLVPFGALAVALGTALVVTVRTRAGGRPG
jgi:hypothetical protein